ncbi:polynucleotide kinase-phosphatase [Minwuia sp.]|uniref:polynucleotide kinase-phosphatase n=1 Tax=Minwuia sp. TaxID=2493630 RepID=UPI003A92439B
MSAPIEISIPEYCLVLLIGPSGAGKSTFARRHFKATEIVSSDHYRGVVADDETDQSATKDAFDLVEYVTGKRLAARRLTVIDATNVKPEDRARFVALARKYHALVVGLVFAIDEKICTERNAERPDRRFGAQVVRNHVRALKRGLKSLQKREGVRMTHIFSSPEEMDALKSIERTPLWPDKRHESGPFDIIGDIHGCAAELESLLRKLGYGLETDGVPGLRGYRVTPPEGRRAVFVGDLVDRGPRSPDVLRLVKGMVDAGTAFCVIGNHENKLIRKLKGKNVKLTHGLAETVEQFEAQPEGFAAEMCDWMDGLISHYVFDRGDLCVAHAGLREDMQNRASGQVRSFAMYGDTTGEIDAFGLPVRADWAAGYRGQAKVVYGHTPTPDAEWINGTICIDTGCVFGGRLTALRWPELELVDVPAEQVWCEPVRPLVAPEPAGDPTAIRLDDVQGKRAIETGGNGRVMISEAQAAGALETMSRFAVDPRWLIYLPPTMSPVETSAQEGWLERPEEAFAFYRARNVAEVVCEEKHMGSRAVAIICRDAEVAEKRFRSSGRTGVIHTRTGRSFFPANREAAVLERLRTAITQAGWWDRFDTGWVCLDMEIMPWSAKAQSLITEQYAPVGSAAQIATSVAEAALARAVARGVEVGEEHAKVRARREAASAFADAYRTYVWPVDGVDDLKLAPFHLLATEGHVHTDRPHRWHMETLAELAATGDPILIATPWRAVDLNDDAAIGSACAWWDGLTAKGGEGMVVKPASFVARGNKGLVQPAVKVRGREYLRIIYGPDYDAAHHLARLKQRGLGRKRSLALREFALGLESLQRFVNHTPLAKVHECVFGVLALETEPVDPRL